MTAILAPIRITFAQVIIFPAHLATVNKPQTRNHQLHNGTLTPFVIVPFNDGSLPTAPLVSSILDFATKSDTHQHNLPPLFNAATINTLTAQQATAYANGYELGHIPQLAARKKAIARAIGCTVPL
jgi:hypothetical protein